MRFPLRLLPTLGLAWLATFSISTASAVEKKPAAKANQANAEDMWVVEPKAGTLPERVTHHTYRSAAMKRDVGYCIYLPPGYERDSARRYPVIYELHGAGGNETKSVFSAQVLHEGILAGRWPEMIMVFPNGGRSTMYQDSADGRFLAETTFMRELIPHIDATYRTIADRKGRCIEGFSMGGRGSTNLAMKFPGTFCSLFNQSGNVYPVSETAKEGKTGEYPLSYLGSDPQRLLDNDAFANLRKNLAPIKRGLRIQVACGTADDGHLKTVRDYHRALTEAGVEHSYFEVEGLDHNQKKMIEGRMATWFDFHVESLRLAGAELHRYMAN
ncbi:MAG: alpha/beta hydrolase-fold protein [Chthoniobacteraceae bacterium]